MDKEQIRLAVLRGESSTIRDLLLTPEQVKLVRRIQKMDFVTTALLAACDGLSAQNASAKLRTLHRKGYLLRKEMTDPTGGIIHTYEYWPYGRW